MDKIISPLSKLETITSEDSLQDSSSRRPEVAALVKASITTGVLILVAIAIFYFFDQADLSKEHVIGSFITAGVALFGASATSFFAIASADQLRQRTDEEKKLRLMLLDRQNNHIADLEKDRAELQEKMAKENREHQESLSKTRTDLESRLSEANRTHAGSLARQREEHEASLERIRTDNAIRLERERKELEYRASDTKDRHAKEINVVNRMERSGFSVHKQLSGLFNRSLFLPNDEMLADSSKVFLEINKLLEPPPASAPLMPPQLYGKFEQIRLDAVEVFLALSGTRAEREDLTRQELIRKLLKKLYANALLLQEEGDKYRKSRIDEWKVALGL